jgi:FtsP/CotA-like multicopper oxidase with cupredoxin domain
VEIGGGGRYDVEFIMPSRPVALVLGTGSEDSGPSFVFSEDGKGKLPSVEANGILDPTTYGSPAKPSFDLSGGFDREFTMMLDQTYVGGESGSLWLINGELFPRTPTFMVEKGDRVKTVIVNRSWADHPMHLHGHHIQVLSKNGRAVSGSPLVLDTLLVKPGEWYEVAFEANNPGLWMDHCHNLDHAATGMVMHLAYRNVTTPFKMGGHSGNHPE